MNNDKRYMLRFVISITREQYQYMHLYTFNECYDTWTSIIKNKNSLHLVLLYFLNNLFLRLENFMY
jgi:hypothetical protein